MMTDQATEAPSTAKRKPARKQVEAPVTGHEERHDPGTFNIWTGRKLREFRAPREQGAPREPSKYRCMPKLDSGWTRGEGMNASYCCLYFARGLCHHGSDCNYLHRVPTASDEARHQCDYGHDIFGRERGPASKDGRKKGVGSYERECRTLYVHYGGAGPTPVLQLRKLLEENFGEWGPIEDIHIVPNKTIAFVRYTWRSSAEFAKAAMHQQQLLGSGMSEVLDVRWANDDPNPRAVQRVKREREETFRDAYLHAVMELPPEQKQARLQQLNLMANVRPGATTSQYPDTDAQYNADGGYSHDYQGWDQFYYQTAAPGSAAAYNERGDDDEEGTEQYQEQYQQYQEQYQQQAASYYSMAYQQQGQVGAGGWAGEDDVSRYLPPEAWEPPAGQQQQQQQQQGHEGGQQGEAGAAEAGVDDVSRYLPPEAWEAPAGQQQQPQQGQQGEAAAGGGGSAQAQQEPAPTAAEAAAEEALGLIGNYGSSDEDEAG